MYMLNVGEWVGGVCVYIGEEGIGGDEKLVWCQITKAEVR